MFLWNYARNRQEAIEALALAAEGKVKVHYQKHSLEELTQTYKDMEEGKIVGRVVLAIPSWNTYEICANSYPKLYKGCFEMFWFSVLCKVEVDPVKVQAALITGLCKT